MSAGPGPGFNDDRWHRIEDIFHAAADLPPADRSVFLERACASDDQLRREVQSLLDSDAAESNIVANAVAQAAEQLPPAPGAIDDDLVGKHIGSYLITGLIGKGGMGKKTLTAMKDAGAVYLNAIGGAAQFYARRIDKVLGVNLLEFGIPEAMWRLTVHDFVAIVTMDAHGNSLHADVEESTGANLEAIGARS